MPLADQYNFRVWFKSWRALYWSMFHYFPACYPSVFWNNQGLESRISKQVSISRKVIVVIYIIFDVIQALFSWLAKWSHNLANEEFKDFSCKVVSPISCRVELVRKRISNYNTKTFRKSIANVNSLCYLFSLSVTWPNNDNVFRSN